MAFAKITPPQTRNVYQRTRLFEKLDKACERSVVWVTAPPGAGKTTLVASYLAQVKQRMMWLQTDDGDEDLATFFHYLGIAARKASPRSRKTLPELSPEYAHGLTTFSRNYFRQLFSLSNSHSVLVLDNYQDIRHKSKLHAMLAVGFEEIPEYSTVIVISRSEPPAEFSKLIANRSLSLLNESDLKLTPQEASDFLKLLKKDITNELAKRYYHMVDGWAAGLILLLEQPHTPSLDSDVEGRIDHKLLFDYFMLEVFERTDPITQEFLIKTAILPTVPAQVAQEFTGIKQAESILEKMVNHHHFTHRLNEPKPTYRYHPLFRKFLQSRGSEFFTSAALNTILSYAATLLEQEGYSTEALELYIQANDWDKAIPLLLKHATAMLTQGRYQTLIENMERLPVSVSAQSPWLSYWHGQAYLSVNPSQACKHFDSAFNLFDTQNNEEGRLLAWCGVVNAIVYRRATFQELDKWYDWLKQHYNTHSEFPSDSIKAQVACALLGYFAYRLRHADEAENWIRIAQTLSLELKNNRLILQAYTLTIAYYHFNGEITAAEQCNDLLASQIKQPHKQPLLYLFWLWLDAGIHWYKGEPEKSFSKIENALAIGEQYGVFHWHSHLYFQGAMAALQTNNTDLSEFYLNKMKTTLQEDRPFSAASYYFVYANYLLRTSQIDKGLKVAEHVLHISKQSGSYFAELTAHHVMTCALLLKKDVARARDSIANSFYLNRKIYSCIDDFTIHITASWLALLENDAEGLKHHLEIMMRTGKENDIYMSWVWFPAIMSTLCGKALQLGIESEYVERLIRKRKIEPDELAMSLANWPYPIKIYTLGRFSLLVDDKVVSFRGKAQKKPLELFKALIAFGAREVSIDKLSEVLWPDADGDSAYHSLKMTLKRLRELIQYKDALILTEGKLTLDPRYAWVDIIAFERGLNSKEIDQQQLILNLYQSHFLDKEATQPWMLITRERLRKKMIQLVQQLARQYEQCQEWQAVIQVYQRGLAADPLVESFCQGLIKAYQHIGDRAEAIKVYDSFKTQLEAHLGVEPSLQTAKLYEIVKAN